MLKSTIGPLQMYRSSQNYYRCSLVILQNLFSPNYRYRYSRNRKWCRQTGSRQSTPLSTIRTRYGNSVSTPGATRTGKNKQTSLQKGSRYGISVSTPHRRYGHRFRTPFLRTPFPRLLVTVLKFGWISITVTVLASAVTLHFHWFPITVLKVIWINFPKITVTVTVLKCFWIRKVILSNMTVIVGSRVLCATFCLSKNARVLIG